MSGKNCEEALDRLFEFIDRELSDEDFITIAEHLDNCPPCEAELRINERIKQIVSQCPKEAPPEELRLRVLSLIDEARRSR